MLEDLLPILGVAHLRVELQTVVSAAVIAHCCNRAVAAVCQDHESFRYLSDPVPVGHPYLERILLDERVGCNSLDLRQAILTPASRFHLSPEGLRQGLHPVADA